MLEGLKGSTVELVCKYIILYIYMFAYKISDIFEDFMQILFKVM